nr:hypothetical protein [Tanacetum cinerariifolium]
MKDPFNLLEFLRYVDTRPNGEALRTCILSGPYKPTIVLVHAVEAADNSPAVAEHMTLETPSNMSPENKAYFLAKKEAIHLILTGIGDDIYSTNDACQTAQEIWEAIERLQQGQRSISSTTLAGMVKQYQNEVNELRAEKLARNANPLALVATDQASQEPFSQTSRSHRSSAPSPKPSIPSRSHTTTRHKGKEIAKPITPPSETAFEEDNDPEQALRDKDMQKNLALIAKYFKKIYKPTNNNLKTSSNSKNKNADTTLWFKNDGQSGQFGNQRMVNVAGPRENVGSKVVQQSGIQCFNCREYGHFAKECRKPKRVKDFAYHKEKMLLCKEAEQGVLVQAKQYDWLADTDEEVDEQELEAHYSYMAKIQEVPTADSGTDSGPVEQVQYEAGYNLFANHLQHFEQSESVSNTCLVGTDDSNVIPDSPDICEDDIQNELNDAESDDERVALANLKLDVDENKKIQKQLKKANTTLAQELKECKAILAETSQSLGESISVRDSFLVALQTKQAEFEKFKAFNDRTVDFDKLERKLNDALGQLAHKDTVIREGLKTKAYELSVVKEKHDELMKQSLLTKSHYEGLAKQKTKVITNLKLREEHDIEKMLSMEKQLKFLNEIVYKRSQSIQTIHMMAPKVSTYNGRPTFANPRYLKQAQSEISCLYAYPYDQNSLANRLILDGEETLALEIESRSKLNKDSVKECDCLAQRLSKQTESVSKNVHTELLQCFAKLEKHSISLKIALQKGKEQGKGKSVDIKFDRPSVVRQPNAQRIPKPSVLGKPTPFSNSLDRLNFQKTKSVPKANVSEGLSKPITAHTLPHTAKKAVSNTNVLKPGIPQLNSKQSKDKVLPYNSQVKAKKTQVEVNPRTPSVSNKTKSVTACKDSSNSRTLNANAVCATCNKCLIDSNHFACVTKMLNDVHARTKKPTVVPISTRKPKSQANKSITTPNKKKVASKSTNQKPQNYFRMLYENTNKAWKWWKERQSSSGYKWVPKMKKQWVPKAKMQWVPKAKNDQIVQLILFIVDSGCMKHTTGNLKLLCNFVEKFLGTVCFGNDQFEPIPGYEDLVQGNVAFRKSTCFVRDLQGNDLLIADADIPSQQELDLLFGPLYDEFFNAGSNPSTNIQSTSAPSTHTNVHAEANNNDQAEEGEQLQDDKFTNLFCAPTQEEAESSSHNIGNSNVSTFNQPIVSEYRWTNDHPLEQVRGNPSRPVQTKRKLATYLEMCMFALTVSTAEPKNIKEAMADSAWIEAMQEELHQFDRLQVLELVDKPFGKSIIRLKWLWKNKKDKDQTVIHNKVRLVAKGYAQEE